MSEFEKYVAKVMSTAYIADPTPQKKPAAAPAPSSHRFLRRLEAMSKEQKDLLALMLMGSCATVSVHGETYAYRRSPSGWLIRSTHDAAHEHIVALDFSACSCEDSKYRGRVCKHAQVLREVMG